MALRVVLTEAQSLSFYIFSSTSHRPWLGPGKGVCLGKAIPHGGRSFPVRDPAGTLSSQYSQNLEGGVSVIKREPEQDPQYPLWITTRPVLKGCDN